MTSRLRSEIAAAAARMIAGEGADWQSARLRAVREVAGGRVPADALPSSQEIESAVREEYAVFSPEGHAETLLLQRRAALRVMRVLEGFDVFLSGAVLNGAAGPQSNIRIEVFCDDAKEVEIALMQAGIDFEAVSPEGGPMPDPEESLGFLMPLPGRRDMQGVRINVYPASLRGLNPYRREQDSRQQPWESRGRISSAELEAALRANP